MLKIGFNVIHSMNGRCRTAALLTAAILVLCRVNGSEFDSHIVTTQGPSTIFAQRKIPLLLNCSTTSSSESQNVTARWFKNGITLVSDRHVQIMENGSLYIRNVKRNKKHVL
ncbi:hypothetical protein KUTeg_014760 [Tegillarca granosa]|uniref:Uncharacterized protein n=1 Tax=Tegillarca granosa TaxID=220873 RepID=A0ABQ9ER29_TEGGR|nr:hypothetical protein KUTeg_014760 [Tegillarca granosa]